MITDHWFVDYFFVHIYLGVRHYSEPEQNVVYEMTVLDLFVLVCMYVVNENHVSFFRMSSWTTT